MAVRVVPPVPTPPPVPSNTWAVSRATASRRDRIAASTVGPLEDIVSNGAGRSPILSSLVENGRPSLGVDIITDDDMTAGVRTKGLVDGTARHNRSVVDLRAGNSPAQSWYNRPMTPKTQKARRIWWTTVGKEF